MCVWGEGEGDMRKRSFSGTNPSIQVQVQMLIIKCSARKHSTNKAYIERNRKPSGQLLLSSRQENMTNEHKTANKVGSYTTGNHNDSL